MVKLMNGDLSNSGSVSALLATSAASKPPELASNFFLLLFSLLKVIPLLKLQTIKFTWKGKDYFLLVIPYVTFPLN